MKDHIGTNEPCWPRTYLADAIVYEHRNVFLSNAGDQCSTWLKKSLGDGQSNTEKYPDRDPIGEMILKWFGNLIWVAEEQGGHDMAKLLKNRILAMSRTFWTEFPFLKRTLDLPYG